jgi:hypothetical protein
MLNAGIRPEVVLVEIVRPLLNEMRKGYVSEEHWLNGGRLSLPQLLFLQPYMARHDIQWNRWLEARLAPWYAMRPALRQWGFVQLSPPTAPLQSPWDIWGDHPLAQESPDIRRKLRDGTYNQYGKSLASYTLGRGPVQAMRDLLERCDREHIRVVLIVMPESEWFRGLYAQEGLKSLDRLQAQLRDNYRVPLIDASQWSAAAEFQDGHHLMANGAREFTLRLRGELQQLLAASRE